MVDLEEKVAGTESRRNGDELPVTPRDPVDGAKLRRLRFGLVLLAIAVIGALWPAVLLTRTLSLGFSAFVYSLIFAFGVAFTLALLATVVVFRVPHRSIPWSFVAIVLAVALAPPAAITAITTGWENPYWPAIYFLYLPSFVLIACQVAYLAEIVAWLRRVAWSVLLASGALVGSTSAPILTGQLFLEEWGISYSLSAILLVLAFGCNTALALGLSRSLRRIESRASRAT